MKSLKPKSIGYMGEKRHLEKLDVVRGAAAFYVVLHHFITGLDFIPEWVKKTFFSFGQEAVMLFFLLSGFVIYWSVHKTQKLTFKSYFIKRFRRIYFPFLVAILLCIVVFAVNGSLVQEFHWGTFWGNLFMLQDFSSVKPGTWFRPFLANDPFWSLSYEWWFYMLFFPSYLFLFKREKRTYFILALSAVSFVIYNLFPNQASLWLSYYIIWWIGVELADLYIRGGPLTWRSLSPILLPLLFMLSLTLVPVLSIGTFEEVKLGYYPFLTFRHFLAAFLFIIIGFVWCQRKFIYFDKVLGGFAVIAPISYGIYVFHYPILKYLHLESYGVNVWVSYLIKFALILGISYLVEIKLQPIVNRWFKA